MISIYVKNIVSYLKNNLEFILSGLGIFIVVALLWAPFGMRTTDIADGWLNLPKVERSSFISLLNSARPLVYLPWEIAVHISKDSFLGVRIVLAALFWGKAFVWYALLRKLRWVSASAAFLIAILFILFPADSGNFLMRALGRHTGVFFFFLAVLLLVLANQHTNALYWIGMVFAEGISASIAEQGFLLMLVAPAVLFFDASSTKKRKIMIALTWYIVLFLAIINFILAPKGHQEKILDAAFSSQYIKEVILSNLVAYQHIFIDGWWRAIQTLMNARWEFLLIALLISLIAGVTAYLLGWLARKPPEEGYTRRYLPYMLLASMIIIGFSFFPYSLTSFRYETSRVFYYAAAGGALTTGLVYLQIDKISLRLRKVLHFGIWGATIFLISLNGLAQHANLVKISQAQQKILVDIIEQAPSVKPNTFIVLVSGKRWPFTKLDYVFRAALSWTYEDQKIRAMVCSDLQDCISKNLPVARSIVFEYTEDDNLILLEELPVEDQIANMYRPYKRIEKYVPFPYRVQKAFDIKPESKDITPRYWKGSGQTLNDRRVCNVSYTGNCSLLFYDDGILTTFSQAIDKSGNVDDHVELSFWIKSGQKIGGSIPIATLTIFYGNGTQDTLVVSGPVTKSWELQRSNFETKRAYSSLLLQLLPNVNSSLIWVDDIRLTNSNSNILLKNSSFEK